VSNPRNTDAVRRFSQILQLQTISARIDERKVEAAFTELFALLPRLYPATWKTARVTAHPPWRLVLELPGTDPALEPVLLMAHYDVVDAADTGWTFPPFSGEIDDEFLWGRGAIDDKSVFVALLEAVEQVTNAGRKLDRGLILAFGGDEELSGHLGAKTTAEEFAGDGRHFHCVVDEGGVIAKGMLRTPEQPIALVGVAEKGFCNIVVTAEGDGGHASMPSKVTAVGKIARAVAQIEKHPFAPRLLPAIRRFFRALAPAAAFPERVVFGNTRLLWPLVSRILGSRPSTDALVRTTQAVTMAEGSSAANVLPQRATATVNCRILPGESVASVLAHYRKVLRRHPVTVALSDGGEHSEPVRESPLDHPAYGTIVRLCNELYPGVLPAPYLVTGSTDSKWFRDLTDCILRFVPVTLEPDDLARVHGTNERISHTNYLSLIRFYERLITEECGNG
jgi:carboxypeptidase PM20D1